MKPDTRIAVICFLSYTLNGLFTLTGAHKVFIPPVIFEPYILTALALIYAVMSYRSWFAGAFALLACAFLLDGLVSQGYFKAPEAGQRLAFILVLIVLGICVLFYAFLLARFKNYPQKLKVLLGLNLLFFIAALVLPALGVPGWVSLMCGFLQAVTGILILSIPDLVAHINSWQKRMFLILIMVNFFDITNYIISIQF